MSSPSIQAPTVRHIPRYVAISAWSVPVLVVGQFALLAVVPVALLVVGTLRSPSLRSLRPYVAGLAVLYAAPLVVWIVRPDGAQSLSKDMHPAFVGLIAAASAVVLWKLHTRKH